MRINILTHVCGIKRIDWVVMWKRAFMKQQRRECLSSIAIYKDEYGDECSYEYIRANF